MERGQGRKETVYTFGAALVSKILTYALLLILANLFSKDVYGKAAFVISIFDLTMFLGSIGVPYILSPWIARKHDVHSVFYSLLMLSGLMMIIGIVIAVFHPWILPIVLLYPILFVRNFAGSYLQANFKYHINQIGNNVYIVVTAVFAFMLKDYNNLGIILAYTAGYLASSILICTNAVKEIKDLFSRFEFNIETLKLYFKKSLITSSLTVSFLFLRWIDTFILGLLSTYASIAAYNIALPVANSVTVISIPLSFYMLSKIPKVENEVHSISILKTAIRISFMMSLLALIAINSVLYLLVRLFFPVYVGIEIYIMLLSIGILFYAMYEPIYYYVSAKLNPEMARIPIFTAISANILLDVLLIPFFDIYGVVIATIAAHVIAFTMLCMKLEILKDFYKAYFMAVLIVLSYLMGYAGLALLIAAVPLTFMLGLFKKNDYMIIKETLISIVKRH